MTSTITRGDTFIAYPEERLARRHMITVTRCAKNRTWADIAVQTWAVMWTKRQPLVDGDLAFPHETFGGSVADWFLAQQEDFDAMWAEATGCDDCDPKPHLGGYGQCECECHDDRTGGKEWRPNDGA